MFKYGLMVAKIRHDNFGHDTVTRHEYEFDMKKL